MNRLIRAEVRKVFTTKLWWGMLIGAVMFTVIGAVATLAGAGNPNSGRPPLTDPQAQRAAFGSASAALIFALVVGIIGMTSEYRHFTTRPTFLFEPRRVRVVVAKLVAYGGLGVFYSVICVAVAIAVTLPWLSAKGIDVSLADNGIPRTLVTSLAIVAIYGVVGVGVGVLARNQIVGVISALAYLFVLEPLIRIIPVVKHAYKFLPGGAGGALDNTTMQSADLLGPWAGGVVLVGWGLLFAALGALLTIHRDVP